VRIPPSPVKSREISVGTAQLKPNAVTGAKVKDGSLTAADFGAHQLPAGPQGPQGAAGACHSGERATGGGFYAQGRVFLEQSYPAASPGATATQWGVEVYNADAGNEGFTASSLCATP
jgi:hypothetical protein